MQSLTASTHDSRTRKIPSLCKYLFGTVQGAWHGAADISSTCCSGNDAPGRRVRMLRVSQVYDLAFSFLLWELCKGQLSPVPRCCSSQQYCILRCTN